MTETSSNFLDKFDAIAAEVMAERQIPGMALAVVRKDEPPLLRCWGSRDIETAAPVGPDTLFPICSVTKSFTATGLALLVDEGRLVWDARVRDVLPEFLLRDLVATEQATLRDLLTHRTGLPRHDWVHMGGHLDNAGMLAALHHLEPSKPFRSVFQYQNLMYLVAGMVLERVSGERWEDFIGARILLPLGMGRATTSLEDMAAESQDYAAPHAVLAGALRRIPVRPINTRPGGGICASITEMAAYVRFHLDPVAGLGSLRLSPYAAGELSAPQMYVGVSDIAEIGAMHYGFGFGVLHYRGARCISHGGGWSGYNCDLRLLPDHASGAMLLTNGHEPSCGPLMLSVVDGLLGLDRLPWTRRLGETRNKLRDQGPKNRLAREEARRRDTTPSHEIADYANEYEHPAYGVVRISRDGAALHWQGFGLDLPMAHRHYDVFEIGADPAGWFENKTVRFDTGTEGDIEGFSISLEPVVPPIVFQRRPEPRMATHAFLETLTGLYRHGASTFRVAFDATGQLTFTRNSGEAERLIARHGMTFGFADNQSFGIEFRCDARGVVDAMISHEPSGTYLIERVAEAD